MRTELSRRDLLAVAGAGLAAAKSAYAFQSSKKLYAYVSSWTQARPAAAARTSTTFGQGGGGGVTAFAVNTSDGSLTQVWRTSDDFDGLNGGSLCISPDGRYLYCTNEVANLDGKAGAGGGVHSFAIDQQNGSLTHLNVVPSIGSNACFIVIDKTGKRVVVANHGGSTVKAVTVAKRNGVPVVQDVTDDGTVTLFPVKADGSLENASDVVVFERRPPTEPGLPAAAHSVNFDQTGRWIIACDVGYDHIYAIPFDPSSRVLGKPTVTVTPTGRAPRHSAFHPRKPYFFITNEREAILSSFHFDSKTGEVRPINTIPVPNTAASGGTGDIRMHANGKFVYATSRDSLVIASIDEETGRMSLVDVASTPGGAREFDFDPSGKFVYACNQTGNKMMVYSVDANTGKITPTGAQADVQRPACVKFVAV